MLRASHLQDRRSASRGSSRSAGFSLLEMVVAVAILAIALVTLYQAAGGATRNVRADDLSVAVIKGLLARNEALDPA